jgi:hypothetical protein
VADLGGDENREQLQQNVGGVVHEGSPDERKRRPLVRSLHLGARIRGERLPRTGV